MCLPLQLNRVKMSALSDLNDEYNIKLKAATEYALQVHVMRYLDGKIRQGRNVIQTVVHFLVWLRGTFITGATQKKAFS